MSRLPTYGVEAPEPDPAEVEQMIAVQRDGLQLVLRDLGLEVARHLGSQEEALAKVTNALKRKLQTGLRGQVKALIPLMDHIHGRIASGIAEQQVALSTLMDQATVTCTQGFPAQDATGKQGCYYDGALHYPDGSVLVSPPTSPTFMPVFGQSPTGAVPLAPAPAPTPTPTSLPGTYPVPAPAGGTGDQTPASVSTPPPAMCCPPCPAPVPPTPTAGGPDSGASSGGAGGAGGSSTSSSGQTGAAGAGSSPPCPAALGYALSDCGLNVWREGASGLLSSEVVQAMLAGPDWRDQLLAGATGPMGPVPFPAGLDPLAPAAGGGDFGYFTP